MRGGDLDVEGATAASYNPLPNHWSYTDRRTHRGIERKDALMVSIANLFHNGRRQCTRYKHMYIGIMSEMIYGEHYREFGNSI